MIIVIIQEIRRKYRYMYGHLRMQIAYVSIRPYSVGRDGACFNELSEAAYMQLAAISLEFVKNYRNLTHGTIFSKLIKDVLSHPLRK